MTAVLPMLPAILIALGLLFGLARLVLRSGRGGWQKGALAVLMVASGGLLYLTLYPPPIAWSGETLVVLTADAPRGLRAKAGERVVALPEAAGGDAERVPDLATALRRYRRVERFRIVGAGLTARDREAAATLRVAYAAPPMPRGLVALSTPGRTATGATFAVGGTVAGVPRGRAELLDPAGRRIDATGINNDGGFNLLGSARAAGRALFTLRLRDARGAKVSDTPVPLWTVTERPVRVLILAAPGAEPKYLRRWATDAGLAVTSPLDAGGGVRLGDAPVALDRGALRRFDALILDDRTWQGLGGGGRSAIASAVADGLGVVLRMTTPANAASRREWAALGVSFAGGERAVEVALPPEAIDAPARAALAGPSDPDAGEPAALDDPAPELTRWDVRTGPGLVPLIRDDDGAVLAAWRARGAGRVAVMSVADSYALVLNGQGERFGDWWSGLVATVARAEPGQVAQIEQPARVGGRMTICGLAGSPNIRGPDGATTRLLVEPGGCAGLWPTAAGWHSLITPGPRGAGAPAEQPFLVRSADAMAVAARFDLRQTTLALTAATPPPRRPWSDGARGPAWRWFLAWLAVSGAMWWLERRWRA